MIWRASRDRPFRLLGQKMSQSDGADANQRTRINCGAVFVQSDFSQKGLQLSWSRRRCLRDAIFKMASKLNFTIDVL
jgi:hypothetical protein